MDNIKLRPVELKAVKEIRAKEFDFGKENEIHTLLFDLDHDNISDTIICSFYERWGNINWKVHFSNGKNIESDLQCKRIGVLESKTHNVSDLVLNLNTILIWDNGIYKEKL